MSKESDNELPFIEPMLPTDTIIESINERIIADHTKCLKRDRSHRWWDSISAVVEELGLEGMDIDKLNLESILKPEIKMALSNEMGVRKGNGLGV